MAVIPSLLSERRAAAVLTTPATTGLPRRRVGTKVRRALQRLLWRAQKLGGTQDLHSMIQTLTDCRSRCPTLREKSEYLAPNTPLPAEMASCRQPMVHQPASQPKNLTGITTRTIRFCWVPRSNSVGLPLARSLPRSVVRNVAAFRHHILLTRKPRWETN